MTSRVRIFNRDGMPLTELDVIVQRTWRLNKYGDATFTISARDPKATERNLNFGNIVFVEHSTLPAWCGVIDTPRSWANGTIQVSVRSAEYLLYYRVSGKSDQWTGSYGVLFSNLINTSNNSDTFNLLEIGDTYSGGKSATKLYNYANVYNSILDIAKESGYEWNCEPYLTGLGYLRVRANFLKRSGATLGFTLQEGSNIILGSTSLIEQGTISNRAYVYGKGDPFASKPVGSYEDAVSLGQYGSRAIAFYSDETNVGNLNNTAIQSIALLKSPRRTFALGVIDLDGSFATCKIGNVINLKYFSVGFTGAATGAFAVVRISAMTYSDADNILYLTASETTEEVYE